MVDVVVASPGRLLQHRQQGNVFFSHVNKIIIDEVDTMLTQGFGSDIRGILKNVFRRVERTNVGSENGDGKCGRCIVRRVAVCVVDPIVSAVLCAV